VKFRTFTCCYPATTKFPCAKNSLLEIFHFLCSKINSKLLEKCVLAKKYNPFFAHHVDINLTHRKFPATTKRLLSHKTYPIHRNEPHIENQLIVSSQTFIGNLMPQPLITITTHKAASLVRRHLNGSIFPNWNEVCWFGHNANHIHMVFGLKFWVQRWCFGLR
jgi:hypothetical protein